jgi:hypothetical protein
MWLKFKREGVDGLRVKREDDLAHVRGLPDGARGRILEETTTRWRKHHVIRVRFEGPGFDRAIERQMATASENSPSSILTPSVRDASTVATFKFKGKGKLHLDLEHRRTERRLGSKVTLFHRAKGRLRIPRVAANQD